MCLFYIRLSPIPVRSFTFGVRNRWTICTPSKAIGTQWPPWCSDATRTHCIRPARIVRWRFGHWTKWLTLRVCMFKKLIFLYFFLNLIIFFIVLLFRFGHQAPVTGIDALSRERAITAGGFDCTIRIWKIAEESQLIYNGHRGSIECVRLINEENFLSSGDDG